MMDAQVTSNRFALGRFRGRDGMVFAGVALDAAVIPLVTLVPALQAGGSLLTTLERWPESIAAIDAALHDDSLIQRAIPLADLTTLAPLPDTRQIFCTGANYGRHVIEMVVVLGVGAETEGMDAAERRRFGEAYVARQRAEAAPYIFMKPVTSVAGPTDPLILPTTSDKMDWELEIAAVIGRETFQVDEADALDHVAGYMVANDLTARDLVKRTDPGAIGPDWNAAKGGPGFLPIGPHLVPSAFIPDPQHLRMRLWLNGELMQDDSSEDMTFSIARQVAHLSRYVRLLPGDIICTGSPAGNGVARGIFLRPGDRMEAEIEGLGRQSVTCMASAR